MRQREADGIEADQPQHKPGLLNWSFAVERVVLHSGLKWDVGVLKWSQTF